MKNQIQEAISNVLNDSISHVQDAFPSIYSKEDVIQLLNVIKSNISYEIESIEESKPACDIESIKEGIKQRIEKVLFHFDYDYATRLDMNNRMVEVEFDCESLQTEIEDAIDQFKINN